MALDGKFNANNPTGPNSGSGTRIYVTDTGVNSTHKTFGNRVKFGIDTTADPSLGYAPGQDCNGHGTAAASVAAGAAYTQDSGDVTHGYGIARGADIVNVKWGNCAANTSHTRQLAGLDWIHNDSPAALHAVSRQHFVRNSGLPPHSQCAQSDRDKRHHRRHRSRNDSADVCGPLANPTYTNPNLIIVGASDETTIVPIFRATGSVSPCGPPASIFRPAAHNQNDASTDFAGTSAAAPAVAGAAASSCTDSLTPPRSRPACGSRRARTRCTTSPTPRPTFSTWAAGTRTPRPSIWSMAVL
ncbi:S8 family serine peptidase [Streptomyces sp. 3211]|uniref:S8 family serine peptidase n=1 Tax=Streptomyces sp. 3211 TaxID=1964449 RepID=UPI001F02DED0|nr:S8 family serine peptidase [Streptomyces sp. 3211]